MVPIGDTADAADDWIAEHISADDICVTSDIPLATQHYPMLQRNLVYTGVTRGKRLVVLVGQRKALAIAVKGGRVRRRWSKLREWLMFSGSGSDVD